MTIPSVDNTTLNNLSPNLDVGDVADPALRLAAFQYIYAELAVIVAEVNSLPTANIQNLAVTTAKINDLAVVTGKIADMAVTTAKLNDLSVTLSKMAPNSVGTTQLINEAVTRAKIAQQSVGAAQLDSTLLSNFGDIAVQAEFDRRGVSIEKYANLVSGGDWTAAIQSALNNNSFVYIPPGTYPVSSTLKIKSGTVLIGHKFESIIFLKNGSNCPIIANDDIVDGNENIMIRGVKLDGNKANNTVQDNPTYTYNASIVFKNVSKFRITDVVFKNAVAQSVELTTSGLGTVDHIYTEGSYMDGIKIWKSSHDIFVAFNDLIGPGSTGASHGIEIHDGAYNISAAHNNVSNWSGGGISLEVHPGEPVPHDVTIVNNIVTALSLQPGIFVYGRTDGTANIYNVLIEENEVAFTDGNNNSEGIDLWYTQGVDVRNNNVKKQSFVASKGVGIKVNRSSDFTIIGNRIDKFNMGIKLAFELTNFEVYDNKVREATYGINWGYDNIPGPVNGNIKRNTFLYVTVPINDELLGVTSLARNLSDLGMYQGFTDIFYFAKAANTTYVRAATSGNGAVKTVSPSNHPDLPRNLSITATNVAAPSGNVTIEGIGMGGYISEDIPITPGGTSFGVKPFSKVTSIIIPATVSASDSVSVGISDKLGLTNAISDSKCVYKIKRNGTDLSVSAANIDTLRNTVNLSPIVDNDVITIYYRVNTNKLQ